MDVNIGNIGSLETLEALLYIKSGYLTLEYGNTIRFRSTSVYQRGMSNIGNDWPRECVDALLDISSGDVILEIMNH